MRVKKSTLRLCANNNCLDEPAHLSGLISVISVRGFITVPIDSFCRERRPRSDLAKAQPGFSLRCQHSMELSRHTTLKQRRFNVDSNQR